MLVLPIQVASSLPIQQELSRDDVVEDAAKRHRIFLKRKADTPIVTFRRKKIFRSSAAKELISIDNQLRPTTFRGLSFFIPVHNRDWFSNRERLLNHKSMT